MALILQSGSHTTAPLAASAFPPSRKEPERAFVAGAPRPDLPEASPGYDESRGELESTVSFRVRESRPLTGFAVLR